MLSFHEVAIGVDGLPACSRCTADSSATPYAAGSIMAQLRSHVAEGSGTPNVVFTGFEPFSHPELPALIAGAAGLGYERIRLRTDAGALAMHGNAQGALAAGANHVEVVLLGPADSHDLLSGRPGLFSATRAGVDAYLSAATASAARVFVSAYVPVCRHNVKVAPETVVAAAALGATAVVIDAQGIERSAQAAALLEAAVETGTVNLVHAWVTDYAGTLPTRCTRPVWESA